MNTGVEQHYRDNRLNPIHGGRTNGIQSLDLLGRKVTQRGGASLAALGQVIAETVAAAGALGGEAAELASALDASWQRLVTVTAGMFGSGDIPAVMANSHVYLEAFGHVVVAWLWLEQFVAAAGKDGDFYDGKRQAARYFFRFELPKTAPRIGPARVAGPHHTGDAGRLVLGLFPASVGAAVSTSQFVFDHCAA